MISLYCVAGRWPIHCSARPPGFERAAHQREVLARVEIAGAGMARLDDVRGDDVEPLARQQQEVAAVVHADADVRLIEHVVVDVREERRAPRTLSDSSTICTRVPRCWLTAPARRAAAEADDQRIVGRGVQHHRQVADDAVQPHHVRRVVRLVQPVEIERAAELAGVHADRGLHALLAPELAHVAAVAALVGGGERIGHARREQHEHRKAAAASATASARGAADAPRSSSALAP